MADARTHQVWKKENVMSLFQYQWHQSTEATDTPPVHVVGLARCAPGRQRGGQCEQPLRQICVEVRVPLRTGSSPAERTVMLLTAAARYML